MFPEGGESGHVQRSESLHRANSGLQSEASNCNLVKELIKQL